MSRESERVSVWWINVWLERESINSCGKSVLLFLTAVPTKKIFSFFFCGFFSFSWPFNDGNVVFVSCYHCLFTHS